MSWAERVTENGLFGIAPEWLPFAAFWLLLFVLVALELACPFRRDRSEPGARLVVNFGLGLVNALIVSALPVSTVLAARWAQVEGFGLMHALQAPLAVAIATTLIVRSLLAYGLHRLAHRSPLLWRMHKVHHCDTTVDLSTGVRHHPLELLYVALASAAAAVLLGLDGPTLAIYELAATGFALWTHVNLRLPERLDCALCWLVMTPAAHRIHHSAAQPETDTNYGDVFTCWDRLFGTWRELPQAANLRLRIGLGDGHDGSASSLSGQLLLPFKAEQAAVAATGLADRS